MKYKKAGTDGTDGDRPGGTDGRERGQDPPPSGSVEGYCIGFAGRKEMEGNGSDGGGRNGAVRGQDR